MRWFVYSRSLWVMKRPNHKRVICQFRSKKRGLTTGIAALEVCHSMLVPLQRWPSEEVAREAAKRIYTKPTGWVQRSPQ